MAYRDLQFGNPNNLYVNTLRITSTATPTDTASGALVLSGGASIATDLFVGGALYTNASANNSFAISMSGPWATPFYAACDVIRLGELTILNVAGIDNVGTVNTYITSTPVPEQFRSVMNRCTAVGTFDTGGDLADHSLGYAFLAPSGVITMYKTPSSSGWNTGSHCGYYSFSFLFTE